MHQYPEITADGCKAEGLAVRWQDGPIGDGFNGATVEVLIRAAHMRLEEFQRSPLACSQNREALGMLISALAVLDDRTRERYKRGILGQMVS